MLITAEQLREILHYAHETGIFRWLVSPRYGIQIGETAGTVMAKGCLTIKIGGRMYLAHRLAFLWMTGVWPKKQIDHRNGNPSANRWVNLREATASQNGANSRNRRHNTSGFKGVHRVRRHQKWKWRAMIRVNHKPIFLGHFDHPEHAASVYHAAAIWYFGSFARADDSYRGAIEPDMLWRLDGINEKLLAVSILVSDLDKQLKRIDDGLAKVAEIAAV